MSCTRYHKAAASVSIPAWLHEVLGGRTTSLGESGALSASAISWAFWLTLPLRVLIVLKASLRLFWRPCLVEGPGAAAFTTPNLASLRGCHLSAGFVLPLACAAWLGLADRDELRP